MIQDSTPMPLDGTWRHFVYVLKYGVAGYLYTNGVLVGTANSSNMGGNVFSIGGGEYNQYYFTGSMDEVGIWNRSLTTNEISSLYNNGSGLTYGSTIISQSTNPKFITTNNINPFKLKTYWNFNESSGTRYDYINNQQITETNGTVGSTSGLFLSAANITNGNNAWLTLPAGICDVGSDQKSFSLWFKLNQTGVGYQWIGPMQGTGHDVDELNVLYIETNSTLNMLFMTTTENYWTYNLGNNIVPTANVWHHYVLTLGNGVATAYYDGSQIAQFSYTGSIKFSNGQYTLGHYNAFPSGLSTSPFGGKIDELSIWDKILSSSEVTSLYNSGNGLAYNSISATSSFAPSTTPQIINSAYSIPTTNLALWLDASDNSTVINTTGGLATNGNTLSAWKDKSGNNNHAKGNFSGGTSPVYNTNQVNGYPTVYTGGGKWMDINTGNFTSPMTVYAVTNLTTNNNQYQRLVHLNITSDQLGFIGTYNSFYATFFGTGGSWYDTSQNTPTLSINPTYTLLELTDDGSIATPYVNKVAQDTKTGTSSSITGARLFEGAGVAFGLGQQWQGNLAELIIYNRVLSGSERTSIEVYLKSKYAIT